MIGYTMVGTRDLDRALRFYDPIFGRMGLDVCFRDEQSTSWGKKAEETYPRFFTGYPVDGNEATIGNGTMTAFLVTDTDTIDQLYALAVGNGGSSEGEAGPRPEFGDNFYAAYVRDPDGNKIAFVSYTYDT